MRPPRDGGARGSGANSQAAGGTHTNDGRAGRTTNTNRIVQHVDNLCTNSAIGADLLAYWAYSRRDAPSARLAADALTLATDAHALQARLAAKLGSETAS
jgi:hypothetical protein